MKGVFSMNDEIYERLAEVLDRLPNGFPRTPSNVEIQMLKKLFTPEEARLAASMTKEYESVEKIASRFGMEEKKLQHILIEMAKRWQVLLKKEERKLYFRLAPFIVGIYEGHLERMDHKFAHLFEEYMYDGGAVGIMKPLPALHRVVPAQGSVKSEWILPYEDVRRMLEEAKAFGVRECICRKQQDLVGKRKCDFPLLN
jgi:electron transport complex protein RnfB